MSDTEKKALCTFKGCVLNAHYLVLHPDPEVRYVGYACYQHAREHDYRPFRLVPMHPIGLAEKPSEEKSPPADSSLVIGSANGEHLRVVALKRTHPESAEFWESNWIDCAIDVSAGGFQGALNANLRAEELFAFRDALRQLGDHLAREALFETIEHWLTIRVVGDGRGQFQASCELRDAPEGNRLSFLLAFSREGLTPVMRALDAIVTAFPVLGRS